MKFKKMMIVVGLIAGCVLLAFFIGKVVVALQFKWEVKQLFLGVGGGEDKCYNTDQLEGLPVPAQRYFGHVLKDGQAYIRYVRMMHDGQFRTGKGKKWVAIKGEQYATTGEPGFIWKGLTSMFTARDMYIGGHGRLVVTLFSVLKMVDGQGAAYDQGELLRWLGESVMYPTNLLPSDKLKWEAIDEQSAKIVYSHNGLSLFFVAQINDVGEITELETERYRDAAHLEKWVIKISNYKAMNDVMVPTVFDVMWRLKDGDFSYARFNMKRVEYGVKGMF